MRMPVAHGFYPSKPEVLRNRVNELLNRGLKKEKAFGAIAPHAGYEYSGWVAGATYSSVETEKRRFMIFCPNHTGYGLPVSLSQENWQTPLGVVEVDKSFGEKIPVNEDAHRYEHSLEVQLPFLQVLFGDFKLIPICLSHLSLDKIEELSKQLVDKDIFYIASSDFTHFGPMYGYMPVDRGDEENLKYVESMDRRAIDLICKIRPEKFYEMVTKEGLTICGFVPITLMLFISRELGAKKGKLIKYSTSYETNPNPSFVSYAGILIE